MFELRPNEVAFKVGDGSLSHKWGVCLKHIQGIWFPATIYIITLVYQDERMAKLKDCDRPRVLIMGFYLTPVYTRALN